MAGERSVIYVLNKTVLSLATGVSLTPHTLYFINVLSEPVPSLFDIKVRADEINDAATVTADESESGDCAHRRVRDAHGDARPVGPI